MEQLYSRSSRPFSLQHVVTGGRHDEGTVDRKMGVIQTAVAASGNLELITLVF